MKRPLLFLAIACSIAVTQAEPPTSATTPILERDLGVGLVYHRAAQLPEDLPAAAPTPDRRSHVLDLRFAQGDTTAGTALVAWVRRYATPRTPVFILANAQTKPQLLAPFSRHDPASGILILGPEAPEFSADITVKVSAADDRRAYEALATAASISTLLTDNPDKPRNDEARLTKDHAGESAASAESQGDDDPAAAPEAAASVPAKPTPVVDVVLQRAVHLHRALLALKKL